MPKPLPSLLAALAVMLIVLNASVHLQASGEQINLDCDQLILVTADGYHTSKARIQTFERNEQGLFRPVIDVSGRIGKNGLTTEKSEGDGQTPVGLFTLGTAFGRYKNPGLQMPYRRITSDDVWVDDPASALYNSWQSKAQAKGQWTSAEKMNVSAYNYGFVINYNVADPVPNAGSAIFFHISSSATSGCVATSKKNVLSVLKWLDPEKSPLILICTEEEALSRLRAEY
jgi:L,D-peptidoglycan transpeptidase YkuD (ErfK/YbiS/YcfS/YnhG family)